MKLSHMSCSLIFSVGLLLPASSGAQDEIPAHIAEMEVLAGMFRTMTISQWDPDEDRLVFFYGDRTNVVRQVELKGGVLKRLWKSYPLGGTIREIFVEDLDVDGVDEVITYTSAAEINVWEKSKSRGFAVRWESVHEDFETLEAMTVANIDADEPLELILCADHHLMIYDGVNFIVQKEGREEISPLKLLVGNVDGDPEEELVTSDGHVINLTTLRIEWSSEPFGDPLYLYDFNRDGALDLIGEQLGAINAWDLRNRREIW